MNAGRDLFLIWIDHQLRPFPETMGYGCMGYGYYPITMDSRKCSGCHECSLSAMKFFISSDQDCHWYLVPLEGREEFIKWSEQDPDADDFDPTPPKGVSRINGGPESVIFENPVLS